MRAPTAVKALTESPVQTIRNELSTRDHSSVDNMFWQDSLNAEVSLVPERRQKGPYGQRSKVTITAIKPHCCLDN